MHGYVGIHRRTVLQAYHRFLAADRSLQEARSAALVWNSGPSSQKTMLMGDTGSRLRRLHERRDRALERLALLRQTLDQEKRKKRKSSQRSVLLLEMRPILKCNRVVQFEGKPRAVWGTGLKVWQLV